jgi:hypothetical protein
MMSRATVADAIRHYRGGNRAAARQVCEGILAARPADHDARLLLALLLIDDGEAERGGKLAEEIPDETGARAINVPHRQNRVVIFNPDLFHATAPLTFRDGYENRRINITMLYGRRGS